MTIGGLMTKQDLKVLIVDDDSDTRVVIMNLLEKQGYTRLRWAEDGDVAIEKIEASTPDIVICDWNMPKMSGIEVLKKIRNTPGLSVISFLMLTAEKQKHEVQKAIQEGVNDYLIKPFKEEDLKKKMASMVEKRCLGVLKF